jgi:hypothetical protein
MGPRHVVRHIARRHHPELRCTLAMYAMSAADIFDAAIAFTIVVVVIMVLSVVVGIWQKGL